MDQLTRHDPGSAREKHTVALASVLAAIGLTGTKLGVGLWTNSLGILSEALHSGLDLVAAMVTLWAIKISAQPVDSEHTYGHGKFENLSALFETLLLFVTCIWIVWEAVSRLLFKAAIEVEANLWAFGVIILSILVDYGRSRALKRVALKYDSQALEADALHFSTDIWSSSVVLLGLLGVLAAGWLRLPWLRQADSVAALGVALIVISVSYRLARKSLNDLLDAVPGKLKETIAAAARVPGVRAVRQVRVRRSGPETFVDITVAVEGSLPLPLAHEIADRSESAIRQAVPHADITVHVEPEAPPREDIIARARLIAGRFGLEAHCIHVFEQDGQLILELHLEVGTGLTVGEAHRLASEFEAALRNEIPALGRIATHLEPDGGKLARQEVRPLQEAQIRRMIEDYCAAKRLAGTPHDITLQSLDRALTVSLHYVLPATMPITDAHRLTEQLEYYLRQRLPRLQGVLVHVEPLGESAPAPPPAVAPPPRSS